jgi:hypothetical protein
LIFLIYNLLYPNWKNHVNHINHASDRFIFLINEPLKFQTVFTNKSQSRQFSPFGYQSSRNEFQSFYKEPTSCISGRQCLRKRRGFFCREVPFPGRGFSFFRRGQSSFRKGKLFVRSGWSFDGSGTSFLCIRSIHGLAWNSDLSKIGSPRKKAFRVISQHFASSGKSFAPARQ